MNCEKEGVWDLVEANMRVRHMSKTRLRHDSDTRLRHDEGADGRTSRRDVSIDSGMVIPS